MPFPDLNVALESGPDALNTPVAWTDVDGLLVGANPAFARWLGVSVRRLIGQPLAALEVEGDALRRCFDTPGREVLRLRRLALAVPGEPPRFGEGWMSRREPGGWLLEIHPV